MLALIFALNIFAAASITTNIIVTTSPENENQAFGQETAWLGDVNADGHDDFLVIDGRQREAGYSGRAYVYFGGLNVDDLPDLVLQQDDTGRIQQALAGPFDFNGDGLGDIAISAQDYDIDGMSDAGAVFIYYGGPEIDEVADFVIPGPWAKYYFGASLAKAGRFNIEDDYDDIAVTIDTRMGWGPMPAVYVYLGGLTPSTESVWGRSMLSYTNGLAHHLEFAGDTNGDGAGDIVLGVPWESGYIFEDGGLVSVPQVGGVNILHGGSWMLHAGNTYQPFDTGTAHLGYDLDGAFDFNGDGLDDVIAAAPYIQQSRLILGSEDIYEKSVLEFIPGRDVAGLGDINGDGYDDMAIADLAGTVWIFWGGENPDTIPDQLILPELGEQWDEVHVGRAGDINHDGFADVLVHFQQELSDVNRIDRVRIYSGSHIPTAVPESPYGGPLLVYGGAVPNPFNPRTEIRFETKTSTRVQVRLFDLQGRLVKTLFDNQLVAGQHALTWNGKSDTGLSVASGVYFVQVLGAGQMVGGQITLLK